MKKILSFALACMCAIGLVGCGKSNNVGNKVDKDGSVYASTRVEGENIICEGYAPYTTEEKYYSATNHKIWEKYRDVVAEIGIKGKYIEPVSNHYIVYEPFDVTSVEWVKFEFTAVAEEELADWYDKTEEPSYYELAYDDEKGDHPLFLYSYNGLYEARYREMYCDEEWGDKFFSDREISRIGVQIIVKFIENTTKEQAVEEMDKIEKWVSSFHYNPNVNISR